MGTLPLMPPGIHSFPRSDIPFKPALVTYGTTMHQPNELVDSNHKAQRFLPSFHHSLALKNDYSCSPFLAVSLRITARVVVHPPLSV